MSEYQKEEILIVAARARSRIMGALHELNTLNELSRKREWSLVITKLEEAEMWLDKGVHKTDG